MPQKSTSNNREQQSEIALQRYKLRISYDGSGYCGWQIQPNVTSVQESLEVAIKRITGIRPRVHGSGRTDQGVHARCQVAHCDLPSKLVPRTLWNGLNGVLPPDISIISVARVPCTFHARRSAKGKEYRYFIWNGPTVPPYLRHMRAHVKPKLNVAAMQKAAVLLIGKQDFAAYSANPNRDVESTVREVHQIRIVKKGHELAIIVKGEGFLYKMVRSLAGFLIRVGEGAIFPGDTVRILRTRQRTARVPTAPACGLFLWNVIY